VKVVRLPALALVPGLLALALLYDAGQEPDLGGTPSLALAPEPAVAPAGAPRSTWFCAGGTADELAPHSVVITNTGEEQRQARVTVVGPKGVDPVEIDRVVPAGGALDVDLGAELRTAVPEATGAVSAVVEVDGGEVVVDHVVSGLGTDRSPCASSASGVWYVPYGSTARPGARQLLVLFNPFVSDAVVDLRFATDNGVRDPGQGEGLVVAGRSSMLVDITDSVTVSQVVAATVTARTGQLVVDRLQQFDGSGENGFRGLAVGGAQPAAATTWFVPGIRLEGVRRELLVVQNPGDQRAEVDVELLAHDPSVFLEPFALSVRPGQYATLALDSVVPLQAAGLEDVHVVVRSGNGVPVVVNRVAAVPETPPDAEAATSAVVPGVTVMAGVVAPARRVVVGAPLVPGGSGSRLFVLNPSPDTIVTATITLLDAGVRTALPAVEIAPRGTAVVDLDELAEGPVSVVIDASAPVVAARESVGITSRSIAPGVPYAESWGG
jgi:hypothetical protein